MPVTPMAPSSWEIHEMADGVMANDGYTMVNG